MIRPTLLAFAVSDDRLSRLRFCCMKLGIAVKPVSTEDYAQPLGALLGLQERIAAEANDQAEVGEMLVMAAFDNALVNRFLAALRQLRIPPFRLKAMLTPTNVAWDACHLYAELSAEHAAMERIHEPSQSTPS